LVFVVVVFGLIWKSAPGDLFKNKQRKNPRLDHALAFDLNHVKTPRLTSRLKFLSYDAIHLWNQLPQDIVLSPSLAILKNSLKKYLNF
jgi:hypothetical protein